jgi:hypothetical protein
VNISGTVVASDDHELIPFDREVLDKEQLQTSMVTNPFLLSAYVLSTLKVMMVMLFLLWNM